MSKISKSRMAAYNHGICFAMVHGPADFPALAADWYGTRPALAKEFLFGTRYGLKCRAQNLDPTSGQPKRAAA